jgi:DNA-binding LacI/PurR family transcriptional regulator
VSYVTIDIAQATQLALSHLAGLGRRRIGYISFVSASRYSQERLAAYRATLTALGLPADESLIAYASLEPDSGARALDALLARPEPPDAIYVYNDRLAIEVLQRLAQRGVRVPAEMAVVGFDEIRTARMTMPPLTTIRYPLAEAAELAVQTLLALQGESTEGPRRLILPAELVIRGSTVG